MSYHADTRGCLLDYDRVKSDRRVDIALGYICDTDSAHVERRLGRRFLTDIRTMIGRGWIGSVSQPESVAYNLKSLFRLDLAKHSGFNKTVSEKVRDYFYDIPRNLLLTILGTIIAAILAYLRLTRPAP